MKNYSKLAAQRSIDTEFLKNPGFTVY